MTDDEPVRSFGVVTVPAGADRVAAYSLVTRRPELLPTFHVRLLCCCDAFRTLPQHAAHCVRVLRLGPDETRAVPGALRALRDGGHLLGKSALVAEILGPPLPPSPRQRRSIRTIAIPTRERPGCLDRLLGEWAAYFEAHRRESVILVCDDARGHESRRTILAQLARVPLPPWVRLGYLGVLERCRFAELLAAESGVPSELVRFALLGDGRCPRTLGGNRNSALLATAGEPLLLVDDDVRLRVTHAPGPAPLRLCAKDASRWSFHAGADELARQWSFADVDLLEAHESLLGREVGACLADAAAGDGVDWDSLSSDSVEVLRLGRPMVALTASGIAGDHGLGSNRGYLFVRGEERAALLASEERFAACLVSRQVVRMARAPTITWAARGGFNGHACGIDNTAALAPFVPILRDSDGLFAVTTRALVPDAHVGLLPHAVLHEPAPPRTFAADEHLRLARHVVFPQIVDVCLTGVALGAHTLESSARAALLGAHLEALGGLPPASFDEFVRLQLWRRARATADELESLLEQHGAAPALWADHVRQHLALLRQRLSAGDFIEAEDLRAWCSPGQARRECQHVIGQIGRLVRAWPELHATARRLRTQGHQPGVAVR